MMRHDPPVVEPALQASALAAGYKPSNNEMHLAARQASGAATGCR